MSSVNETLLPMRGLQASADASDDTPAADTARGAAEVLLDHHVAWRRSSAEPIAPDVMKTHHPVYWHYAGASPFAARLGILDGRSGGRPVRTTMSENKPQSWQTS